MKKLTVFDLDDTLVHGDTSKKWRHFLKDKGIINDPQFFAKDSMYMQHYFEGTLDLSEYLHFSLSPIAQYSCEDIDTLLDECVSTRVIDAIYPQAKELIADLTRDNGGEDVLIISATVSFVVKAVARELGINHAIGVDVAVENNCYTHHVVGTPSFREGKVIRLKEWLTEQNKEDYYSHITFYTDSINDLPLCEYADEAHTVNPCKLLRPIAQERNWPIHEWNMPVIS